MKRISLLVLAAILCLSMSATALAADETAKYLGTWEVEFEQYGKFTMIMDANGIGHSSQDGKDTGDFAFMVRGNRMVSAEKGEDGNIVVEAVTIAFKDENTAIATEDEIQAEFHRIEASTATEMTIDNAWIGTWVADLPEVAGMVMEYKANGTYAFEGGEYKGENSYFVWDNMMVSMSDEGEYETFTFVVIDENTMDVTETSTGAVAQFKRVAEDAKAAA